CRERAPFSAVLLRSQRRQPDDGFRTGAVCGHHEGARDEEGCAVRAQEPARRRHLSPIPRSDGRFPWARGARRGGGSVRPAAVGARRRKVARNRTMRYLIALMFLSQAQNPPPPPTDPARFNTEIVVTPERGETPRSLVPASTVVIDAASLQALPVVHPSEVVSFLPGFSAA